MKIKVLGCYGAEFPNFKPPSFLIDDKILLDAGTTTSSLDEKAQSKISHILLTHSHLDHIKGIPSLADNLFFKKHKKNITLVGIRHVLQQIRNSLLNNTVWPDYTRIPSPTKPLIRLKPIRTGVFFKIPGYRIVSEKVNHSIPAIGYIIESSKNKKLLYTSDTGPTSRLWEKSNILSGTRGIDGAIIEVTFPNRMKEAAVKTGHLTPDMLLSEIKKLDHAPGKIFITHIKPQFFNTISKELRSLKIRNLTIFREGRTYYI